MHVRAATPADTSEMSAVLMGLRSAGLRTSPGDEDFVRTRYIEHVDLLQTTVAVDDEGVVRGFQSLLRAADNNSYGVTPGWGIVGTHVDANAGRQGIGRKLFAETRRVATDHGLVHIDATIGADNELGLAYYGAMGFVEYRRVDGGVCKRFDV